MEVLTMGEGRITLRFDEEEFSFLVEACYALVEHPTSCGGTYVQDIGRLRGEFDMLYQVRERAKNQEAGDTALWQVAAPA